MGKIKILDDQVINIIAAGEVVENPAGMIKELIENSLDANSNKIKIEISSNLIDFKITDDGDGMDRSDLLNSIQRHATSKISTKEDVFNIGTYGFRGEALASISAISKLKIISKIEDGVAHELVSYAGNIQDVRQVNAPKGTTIEIRDLFYNTPARKKFLRKETTELNKIKDVVLKEALANYDVSFSLIIDGKRTFFTTGSGIDKTVFEIFGKNNYKNLDKFSLGFLGNVEAIKNTKDYIFTYVNKRYVKSNLLERAIISGYDTKLMKGKYPFVILFLDLNPQEIDINVDPSKKFVKFSNENIVYKIVQTKIQDYFYEKDRTNWRPNIELSKENKKEDLELDFTKSNDEVFDNLLEINQNILKNNSNYDMKLKEENQLFSKQQGIFEKSDGTNKSYDVLGQVFNTYILVNNHQTSEIEIYDQHIIHEGILFQEFMEEINQNKLQSKPLLFPRIINLLPAEKDIVISNMEIFNDFGFEIDEISENSVAIRKVPDFDFRHSMETVFKEIIGSILKNEYDIPDIRREILTSMSCKGAIKAGEKLTLFEMQNMVRRLHEVGRYTCPHGRPIIVKLTKDDLDKKFGRKK